MASRAASVHFSSARPDWGTPQEFFDRLREEFRFDLDVCALPRNAKVPAYLTPEVDGLSVPWSGQCWMNPPYGRTIGRWVRKARAEAQAGATVVCLLPARTDTAWWHRDVMQAAEVRLVRGRLRFEGATASAPFPSCIVVLRPAHVGAPRFTAMDAK